MEGALIILFVTVFVGVLLFVYDRKFHKEHPADSGPDDTPSTRDSHGEICCGRHIVCEKSLSPLPGEKPVYYDDEELDLYAGRKAEAYTDGETEEFRKVLYTMLPSDIPGWIRSLQLREIELPSTLRDEVIMLLED